LEGFILLAIDSSFEDEVERYDCIECGAKESVTIIGDRGFCRTSGCLANERIQYVYFPHWRKPKTCRAEKEIRLF
jgi:hypothetical protein